MRILSERSGDAVIVTIDGAAERNALHLEDADALDRAIRDAATVGDARFLLLRGVGGWFCVGGSGPLMEDMLDSREPDWRAESVGRFQAVIASLLGSPLFTVALLDGLAAGAGADMVLASDLVLATEAARFALLYAKLGLVPDAGFDLLEWRLGHRALLAYAESRVLTAADVVELGMAMRIDDPDPEAVLKLLRRKYRFAREAFAAAKAHRNLALFGDLAGTLRSVSRTQAGLFEVPETRSRLLHSVSSQRGRDAGRAA